MVSDDGTDAGRAAAQPEERKTETTLTTRIRINIPGSRPIPPVVVRTPVADAEGSADDKPAEHPQPSPAPAAPSAAEAPAEPAAPAAEEKTSDWFAPRKSGAGKGGQGGTSTKGAGTAAGSAAGAAAGAAPGAPGAARPGGAGAPGAARPGGRPGGVVGSMGAPGGRTGAAKGAGLPGATGGPVAPGHGGGTGSFDVTEALAAGPLGGSSRPGAGEPRRDDLPFFSENGSGQGGADGTNGQGGPGAPGGRGGFNGPTGPAGPTSGPVTGDGPMVPPVGGGPGMEPGEAFGGPAGPGGPGRRPGPGANLGPGGGLSDDTAILTPQKPAPEPGTPGYGNPADNVSGHTVTSGIPVVPPAGGSPFSPGAHPEGPVPHTPPKLPEPVAQNVPAAPKPKKKGRSKLVLLGVGVVVVLGGAYGAGLLMNHTDVPKGTTVFGVDIGGGTRDDAVNKLDDTFGSRVNKPLKLAVGGKTVELTPDKAGLQFDVQSTVAKAATSDYNPVTVVGSLFGQQREIEPAMPVDEEKLQAALQAAGGGSGSVTEGTIRFESGKAVSVYGKAGKGIAAAQATPAVQQAYHTLVETGTAAPVTVPTTTQQPTVSNAEVDREMKEFAQPAMSGIVTVQTDPAHSIQFSPQNSLWKFLKVTAVNGKLVDKPDLDALKGLYGQTFDGVKITRANGEKTAVTPQDVYVALRTALTSGTNRVGVIQTDPN
ncbi:hypothetical protein GCM10010121_020400 [Streptomyces brasiliensis]|uniref:Peptidoglycan binding domain-containing protein n=2 Tax=Streptomyces brasiliensis TaxID=1954 RepID=A0A917NLW4_9ACTN|nr:hypothetical protein GCM10010121_020400 [Streptomyces brasiliensis]